MSRLRPSACPYLVACLVLLACSRCCAMAGLFFACCCFAYFALIALLVAVLYLGLQMLLQGAYR
jgi:hypothetical protein